VKTEVENIKQQIPQKREKLKVADLISEIQNEMQMDAKNHSSGVHGLSFCPFHRVCPDYQLANKGISGQEKESYQRLSALIYDQI